MILINYLSHHKCFFVAWKHQNDDAINFSLLLRRLTVWFGAPRTNSPADKQRQKETEERMPTMCKSKLRTLLFFFVHFIYLSLAVYFLFLFFFYLSPLKVCHHARCSFSVGSTCKVVGFFSVGGGFSHIGRLEGRDNGENIEWTNTDHSGVKAPPPRWRTETKKKKTQIQTQLQGLFGQWWWWGGHQSSSRTHNGLSRSSSVLAVIVAIQSINGDGFISWHHQLTSLVQTKEEQNSRSRQSL